MKKYLIIIFILLITSCLSAQELPPGLYHFDEGHGDYSIFVPTTNEHKMIVSLHGSGERAENYIHNWLLEAREHKYIVLAINSFAKTGWGLEDVERILSRVSYFQNMFKVEKALLSGASSGGQFSLYVGINHPQYFDGIATFMATLQGGPTRWINYQEDVSQRLPIYMIHGERDEQSPLIYGTVASRFIRARGYAVTFISEKEMGHEHYRPENEKIIAWFEKNIQKKVQ